MRSIFKSKVKSISSQGKGVCNVDGKVAFVPFVIPGEEIEFELIKVGKKFDEGRLKNVVFSSDYRKAADCEHFGVCGGCDFQHVEYERQLSIKKEIFVDQLSRIGKIDLGETIKIHSSPKERYYRIKTTFQFKLVNKKLHLAHYQWDMLDKVALKQCLIIDENIEKVTFQVVNYCNENLEKKDLSEFKKITLINYGQLIWLQIDGTSFSGFANKSLEDYLKSSCEGQFDFKVECALQKQKKQRSEFANIDYEGFSYEVPYGNFLQVNPGIVVKILNTLTNLFSKLNSDSNFLDIYCGAGLFSFYASGFFSGEIIGIDYAEESIGLANLKAKEKKSINFIKADLNKEFSWQNKIQCRFDVIFMDPPRKGASKIVLDWILSQKPKYIFYLSCEVSSLARDLKVLSSLYDVGEIELFDMFPQTRHFESLVSLKLKD